MSHIAFSLLLCRSTVVSWDFPFGFLPTTSVGRFFDFLPSQQVCKSFFQSALGFSLAQGGVSVLFVPCHTLFHPMRRHLLCGFRCFDKFGLHPDVALANLWRSIALRMSRNNSLGTATSTI